MPCDFRGARYRSQKVVDRGLTARTYFQSAGHMRRAAEHGSIFYRARAGERGEFILKINGKKREGRGKTQRRLRRGDGRTTPDNCWGLLSMTARKLRNADRRLEETKRSIRPRWGIQEGGS